MKTMMVVDFLVMFSKLLFHFNIWGSKYLNCLQLLAEFTRLAGTSYEENFRGQLRKYMTGLTQLPVSRKGRNASRAVEPAFVRELKEEIKSARLESDRQREYSVTFQYFFCQGHMTHCFDCSC